MEYEKLTPTGQRVTNVYCGHVDWHGNPISGCHAKPDTKKGYQQFYYENGGCTSTVEFCDECAKKMYNPNKADISFHINNIDNDESVFA